MPTNPNNLEDFVHPNHPIQTKQKNLNRSVKNEAFLNASFMSPENLNWYIWISMNYLPDPNKRLFFLPCAGGFKTRDKKRVLPSGEIEIDTRKFISQSFTHNTMKPIRDDPLNEKVILSEPLTIIPYDSESTIIDAHGESQVVKHLWESSPMRPDYDLPAEDLSIQGEFIFIERLSLFLLRLKTLQPERKYVFYFGGHHHYFILYYANELAGEPFSIIYHIPRRGFAQNTTESERFMKEIYLMEQSGIYRIPEPVSLLSEFQDRGRYTNKRFLIAEIQGQYTGPKHKPHSKTKLVGNGLEKVQESRIEVTKKDAFMKGFSQIYALIQDFEKDNPDLNVCQEDDD
jgi:hypothetical protein